MAKQKVAILGSGVVGDVLAKSFEAEGHEVVRGSREAKGTSKTFADAASWGDVIVLAVKGTAAETVVGLAGADRLAGKTVIDTTNPIAEQPPVDGVLQYFTAPNESLMERLQAAAPKAHFVKAFSSVGNAFMYKPQFAGGMPTMFICGNDSAAKQQVTAILDSFGWETADMGTVVAARAIEPLCQLWCIPGLRGGSWTHAFKLLRM